MEIIVSDANVFVALYKCVLLEKVFSSERFSIIVPEEIFDELTNGRRRICREYPQLSQLVINLVRNPNHGMSIDLKVLSVSHSINSPIAQEIYFKLDEDAFLDRGEREAIPLTVELSAIFLSCDNDAISEFKEIEEKNGSSVAHFADYCQQQATDGHITRQECDLILAAISS